MIENRTKRRLDLKRLAVFREVLRAGGVNAAAAQLHRSPSAVSEDLAQLQRQLGVPLLRKEGRRLVATARGRGLAQAIEGALLDLQAAWETCSQAEDPQAPLRVATVTGFGRYRLQPALLAAMPPSRRLELRFCAADEVQAQLLSGRVDLGVSYRPLLAPGLESRPMADEHLLLVGPPGSRLPAREDFAALPFVTYDEHEYVFLQWFAHHRLPLPQAWRRGDHYEELEEVLEAVAHGRGWSIVPGDAPRAPAYAGRLGLHEVGGSPCVNPVHLVAREGALAGADASWMLALHG